MTEISTDTQSVIMEREFPHPPERVWRALTQLWMAARMRVNLASGEKLARTLPLICS